MLSVIPAHISEEIKTEILRKMNDPKVEDMRGRSSQFHDLHIRRHKNVR